MIADEVLVEPIDALGRRLRDGEFTVRELNEAYLDRLERVGPDLNAVMTVTRERALSAADRLDSELDAGEDRGPLHGIPYGVKDLVAVEGYPTTWGPSRTGREIDEDAAVVRRLNQGRQRPDRQTRDGRTRRRVRLRQRGRYVHRPRAEPVERRGLERRLLERFRGRGRGRSVGFTVGTETWGSLTTPAAFSGVSAIRPTYDRVSREGIMSLSWTMDKVGPLCRTVGNCERVLRAMAAPDAFERGGLDATDREDGFRVAVPEGANEGEQAGVRENFERTLETLSAFSTVERVSLPSLPFGAMTGTIVDAEAAAAFDDLIESGAVHDLDDETHQLESYRASAVLARDYMNANRVRTKVQRELDALLADYDALVTPARSSVANPIEESLGEYFDRFGSPPVNAAANVTGLPGVTTPNGFGERGLPTAVEFVGRAGEEATVLALAGAYERRTDHVEHASLVDALDRC